MKTYRSAEEVREDYPDTVAEGKSTPSKIYLKAAALFHQSKTTLADKQIGKVKIAGAVVEQEGAGLIAAIEALRGINDDWYLLLTDRDDDDSIKALCAWAESTEPTEVELGEGVEDHRKIYFAQTANREIGIVNPRCVLVYTDNLGEQADAAYVGNVGPFYPQSVTWKFKKPEGMVLPPLTDAQRDALEEANVNFMTEEYKNVYVKNGVCANGDFIDVQMGADYIALAMRQELYAVYLQNKKIPYTDEGFALVANAAFSALGKATNLGIIAVEPDSGNGVYTVAVPKRVDATDEQARARQMPEIVWSAQLEGAVHGMKITGTLKASLSA